jgi:hypothetical protein
MPPIIGSAPIGGIPPPGGGGAIGGAPAAGGAPKASLGGIPPLNGSFSVNKKYCRNFIKLFTVVAIKIKNVISNEKIA